MREEQGHDGQQPGYAGSWPTAPAPGAASPQPGGWADPRQPGRQVSGAPGPGGYGQPGGPGFGQPGGPGFGQPGGPGYSQPGGSGFGQPGGPAQAGYPAAGQPGSARDYLQQGSDPPDGGRQPGRRRGVGLLTYVLVALLAAGAGAGSVWLANGNSPGSGAAAGTGQGGTGHAGGPAAAAGAISSARKRAVVRAVTPGLVDISSRLGYLGGTAAATGMIISRSGLVLTNNHVIEDTTGLSATLVTSQHRFAVRWLGYDKADDVAVVQLVGAANLRTVPLGNSATVRVGDHVVALGNADGLGGAPAVGGAITGLNRTITASDDGTPATETLHGMLQTNANIVPGDSGGSLVSAAGKVIGMDTAAATGSVSQTQQSVGFAIPINKALAIARQIIAGQGTSKIHIGTTGFLGVLVPSEGASRVASPRAQRRMQLQQYGTGAAPPATAGCLATNQDAGIPASVAPARSGALILGELCGTPAARAGISAGDVITAVAGHAITTPSSLTAIMADYRAGASAVVTWVSPAGARHTRTLVLAQAPPQ
ncbi:MAG: S1C family serine protease [Streptosporangiaceae bacterium]